MHDPQCLLCGQAAHVLHEELLTFVYHELHPNGSAAELSESRGLPRERTPLCQACAWPNTPRATDVPRHRALSARLADKPRRKRRAKA